MPYKAEIAVRLREFGQREYGTMAAFARALGMDPKDLNTYLSGRSGLGNKMMRRLEENTKIDTAWLLTGRTAVDVQTYYDRGVNKLIEEGITKEEYEILYYLRGLKIKNRFELQDYFNFENEKNRLNDSLTEYGRQISNNEDNNKKLPSRKVNKKQ